MPKLLYGLELVDLTKSDRDHLNAQARACLKSLFNVSKRSKNDIQRLYKITDVCSVIDNRQIGLLKQLILNKSTKHYFLYLLSNVTDTEYSFAHKTFKTLSENNLKVIEIFSPKTPKVTGNPVGAISQETTTQYLEYIENWHILENRVAFKALLEEHIYRTKFRD